MSRLNLPRQLRILASVILTLVTMAGVFARPVSAAPTTSQVELIDQTTVLPVPGPTSSPLLHMDLLFSEGLAATAAKVKFSLFHSTYASSVLFQQIAAAPIDGAIAESGDLPISCAAHGTSRASFTLGLIAAGGPVPSASLAEGCDLKAPRLQLSCSGVSCTGVYPLVVTVTTAEGGIASRFSTFLDVTAGHVANPVRVSVIAALPATGSTPVRTASSVLAALARHTNVAVTVAPVPALLDLSARRGGSIAAELNASVNSGRALLSDTYVPINPTWLNNAALGAEVARQRDSGRATLARVGGAPLSPFTPSFVGETVVPEAADLHREGAGAVIVSGAQLTTDPALTSGWGQPFSLVSGSSSIRAVATDDRLTKLMGEATTSPVLVANQILGFLAFRYREAPGLITPRGVVLAPAIDTVLPPLFYDALLRGLGITPELRPVTLPAFLGSVPVGGNGSASVRYAATVAVPANRTLAEHLRQGRQTWSSFTPLLSAAPLTLARLDHRLLSAESLALSQPVAILRASAVQADMAALTHDVRVSTSSFTLTSQQGTLPLTIASTAPCPLVVHVDLISDRLTFPSGQHFNVNITQAATTVRIPVIAATTGVLPMRISVTAPGTNVELAGTSITVQVAATSIVGKALTVGAVLVLLWWWFTTWRRSRKEKLQEQLTEKSSPHD